MDHLNYLLSGKLQQDIQEILRRQQQTNEVLKNMATVQDLDAALAAQTNALNSLSESVAQMGKLAAQALADVEALVAKVPDLSSEVAAVNSNIAAIQTIAQAVSAAQATVQQADTDAGGVG